MGEFNRGGQAMKIGNVMSRDVQLIKPDDTIRSAAALMKKIDAGLLPVTENEKLVGMITDRDRSGAWRRVKDLRRKFVTQ
jgi:predicted transcriptional regulator